MDPNETLKELRYNIDRAKDANDGSYESLIIEYFDALDGWLSKGGFLPAEWQVTPANAVRKR